MRLPPGPVPSVPCVGWLTISYVSASPSGSEQGGTGSVLVVPDSTSSEYGPPKQLGAVLALLTSSEIVATEDCPPWPSEAR